MIKQAIILRTDLNMRKGKMCSQAAHASVYSTQAHNPKFKEWLDSGMTKITLGCKSEEELFALYNQALSQGLPAYLVKDLGKTEFKGVETPTCIAIGPDEDFLIDQITKDLKLL